MCRGVRSALRRPAPVLALTTPALLSHARRIGRLKRPPKAGKTIRQYATNYRHTPCAPLGRWIPCLPCRRWTDPFAAPVRRNFPDPPFLPRRITPGLSRAIYAFLRAKVFVCIRTDFCGPTFTASNRSASARSGGVRFSHAILLFACALIPTASSAFATGVLSATAEFSSRTSHACSWKKMRPERSGWA